MMKIGHFEILNSIDLSLRQGEKIKSEDLKNHLKYHKSFREEKLDVVATTACLRKVAKDCSEGNKELESFYFCRIYDSQKLMVESLPNEELILLF